MPAVNENGQTQDRKKRRFHPGTRARLDIKRLQKTTSMLGQRAPFAALFKSHMRRVASDRARENVDKPVSFLFKKEAILMLMEMYEVALGEKFAICAKLAKNAGRVETLEKDFNLALELTSDNGLFSHPKRS